MRDEYYKAIGKAIRGQAGHLAEFVEKKPERTQKEDLYANLFLCFTGIIGAILHLDIPAKDFAEIMGRLFCDKAGLEIMVKITEWKEKAYDCL